MLRFHFLRRRYPCLLNGLSLNECPSATQVRTYEKLYFWLSLPSKVTIDEIFQPFLPTRPRFWVGVLRKNLVLDAFKIGVQQRFALCCIPTRIAFVAGGFELAVFKHCCRSLEARSTSIHATDMRKDKVLWVKRLAAQFGIKI